MPKDQSNRLSSVAEQVGELLKDQGFRLTTVESCTGGWIAQSVTAVAGSSVWFERGFITYSNEAKHELVGVPDLLIIENGSVSGPVARPWLGVVWITVRPTSPLRLRVLRVRTAVVPKNPLVRCLCLGR